MMYLSPDSLRDLVGLNSNSTDVKAQQEAEKDILKQMKEAQDNPGPIKVKMFNLLSMDPDTDNSRLKFIELMSNPKIDLQDLQFDMHLEGEGEDKQLFYTAVAVYRFLPFIGPSSEYSISVFYLPAGEEAYGEFLTNLNKETLVTRGDKQYIMRSSVIRTDRNYGSRGTIEYYYHCVSTFKEAGRPYATDGVPEANKASDIPKAGGDAGADRGAEDQSTV